MDYGYIRYSHSTQERGSSVDRQKKLILDRCPNILEENIFIDKGVSAWSGDNLKEGSEWHRLMKTIVAGDCIYVEQADRVTRKGLDEVQQIFRGIRDRGVTVVTTVDGKLFEANKDTTTEEAISLVLAGSLGKAESDTKSRRVRESYTKRNADAANPKNKTKIKIPLASWIEHENGKYILNEQAETVKLIFDLCISGMGAAAIAIELNKRGIKPFRFGRKSINQEKSKLWGAASVFVILRNKATYGTYTPNAWKIREAKRLKQPYDNLMQEIKSYFPAVLTEATFWQAQEALRLRKTSKTTKQTQGETPFNVWQGVAACACGSRLHVMAKGRNKERYLVCVLRIT